MNRNDLEIYDVLVFERGERCMVVSIEEEKEFAWFDGGGDLIDSYALELSKMCSYNGKESKLIAVYRPQNRSDLGFLLFNDNTNQLCKVWERPKKSALEIEIEIEKLEAEKKEYDLKFKFRLQQLKSQL